MNKKINKIIISFASLIVILFFKKSIDDYKVNKKKKEEINKKMEEIQKKEEIRLIMIKNIVDVGKISYKEEWDRHKSIIEQSNIMILVLTILLTFLAMMFPILNDSLDRMINDFIWISFFIFFALLFISLILSIIVGSRWKYKKFPNSKVFFDYVNNNNSEFQSEFDFLSEKFRLYGETTEAIEKNNNKRVAFLQWSQRVTYVCIGILLLYILHFIILII